MHQIWLASRETGCSWWYHCPSPVSLPTDERPPPIKRTPQNIWDSEKRPSCPLQQYEEKPICVMACTGSTQTTPMWRKHPPTDDTKGVGCEHKRELLGVQNSFCWRLRWFWCRFFRLNEITYTIPNNSGVRRPLNLKNKQNKLKEKKVKRKDLSYRVNLCMLEKAWFTFKYRSRNTPMTNPVYKTILVVIWLMTFDSKVFKHF